jgi:Carboxypeptidase regulatory-like domain/TonB dependent receptor
MQNTKWAVRSLALVLAFSPLHAQSLGTILGTVTDSSGGAVANADVLAVSAATNLQVKAQTTSNGSYQISNLPIGTYTLTFSKTGFQSEVHPQIVVQGAVATTVAGSLKPGAISTTVEVTDTPLLNETDVSHGYVLDESNIRNVPLGTGSFTQLALLSPGVSADFLAGTSSNSGLGNQPIWANGQRDSSNSFSINGVNSDNLFSGKSGSQVDSSRFTLNTGQGSSVAGEVRTNTSVYDAIGQALPSPPQEALQELRVETGMFDATQGARSGAHVALTTKSGSNNFHGEVYEYFQNNIFNAAPFFRNANTTIPSGQKVPPLHFNRPGGTFGGPIRKDKLFFFASWQSLRISDNLSGTQTATVPQHLTDDRSAAALAAIAQQDLGVSVPLTQLNPAAVALFNAKYNGSYLIPSANILNAATAKALGYNVVVTGAPSTSQADIGTASFDYNLSPNDRLSAKALYQDSPNYNPYGNSVAINGFGKALDAGSELGALDYTRVIGPHLTWESKLGFVRQRAYANTKQPLGPSDIGINLFGINTLPQLNLGIVDNNVNKSLSIGPSGNFANVGIFQNKWDLSSNLNWVVGRHTLYFGGSWNHTQLNIINNQTQAASISFTNFATFLTGAVLPSSTFYNGSANRYYRANQVGAFVQDNYKLKSNLTINLGLRYDYEGPLSEKYGTLVNFDSSLYSYDPATDKINNSGLVFAGNSPYATNGVSNSTLKNNQFGFGPRIGAVWSPKAIPHLAIRAGYGLYFDRGEYFTFFSPGAGRGFSGPFGVTMQLPFTVPTNPPAGATLSAPFGANAPGTPGDPSILSRQLPNMTQIIAGSAPYIFGGYDANNTLPYVQNWSFDLQYQAFDSWVITLGYTGNHGSNQVLPIPFNQPGIATAANPIHGQTASYGFNIQANEPIATFEGGNSDLRVPYLGYSSNSVLYQTIGKSNYNALQASVKKRFSHGFQATASYTWSHALDEQSNLGVFFNGNNPLDPQQSYGTATFDRTHVINATYYYELPKVQTKNGFLSALANGWGTTGIVSLQSGQPYNLYDFSGAVAGLYNSTTINVADPILGFTPGTPISQIQLTGTRNVNPLQPTIDTSKIYIPTVAPGTFGVPACTASPCDTYETLFAGNGRNTFRGPFQSRWDAAVAKRFRLTERMNLDLRWDVFNVFNHPDFDVPAVSTGLYTVTRSGNAIKSITVRDPKTTTLGLIQQTLGSPRIMQLSMHLTF